MFKNDRIVCINDEGVHNITIGKIYIILNEEYQKINETGIRVLNDAGMKVFYASYRFITLTLARKNKINTILNFS